MVLAVALIVLLLVVGGWVASAYNRLVRLRNRNEEAWAGIDVQLQRRADLVPTLVETVRGYQIHEREVLEEVTEARTRLARAGGPREAGEADERLESALGRRVDRLVAVAEDYPELKASENFLRLQQELVQLEEDISFARRFYNATTEQLNTAIQSIPTMFVARPFGFDEAEYFKASAEDREVPEVDLGERA